jgi:hypothetical protein
MVDKAALGVGWGGIAENDRSHPSKVEVKNTWSLSIYLSGVKDREDLNIPKYINLPTNYTYLNIRELVPKCFGCNLQPYSCRAKYTKNVWRFVNARQMSPIL